MQTLNTHADELQSKHASLESVQESLAEVDALGKRTAAQFENLKQSRQDLEALRKEIQDFYKSHAEAMRLRDRLADDRGALESFLDRTSTFKAGIPELEARLQAISGKLSAVDDQTQKAAHLVAVAADLDRQMTRLATQQQFVERVEARLNTLDTLATDVDGKLESQIARAAQIEALRSQIDGVSIQVADAQHKLEAVSDIQDKLLPMENSSPRSRARIEKAHTRFAAAQQEEASPRGSGEPAGRDARPEPRRRRRGQCTSEGNAEPGRGSGSIR